MVIVGVSVPVSVGITVALVVSEFVGVAVVAGGGGVNPGVSLETMRGVGVAAEAVAFVVEVGGGSPGGGVGVSQKALVSMIRSPFPAEPSSFWISSMMAGSTGRITLNGHGW
jgi:hypothetical protein